MVVKQGHQKTLSRKTVKKRIFNIYLDGYIRLSERRRLITLEAKGLDLPAPADVSADL